MNDDKKIKTSSRGRLRDHLERKIKLTDDLVNNIGNSNLISSATNSFENIDSEYSNLKEIERLKAIENSKLVQSLRKEKILLMKSYSNEFSFAFEEL